MPQLEILSFYGIILLQLVLNFFLGYLTVRAFASKDLSHKVIDGNFKLGVPIRIYGLTVYLGDS